MIDPVPEQNLEGDDYLREEVAIPDPIEEEPKIDELENNE